MLIVGAGDAGQLMVREMQRNRQLAYTPIGFVDDDPRKRGTRIVDVKVLGTTDDLPHLLRDNKPDEVLIAIPSAPGAVRQRIVENCRARARAGQDAAGPERADLRRSQPRAGRSALCRSRTCSAASRSWSTSTPCRAYVKDRVVMVTGAGGSIGSELCRQLARLGAGRLVLVDKGEPPLFEIERELLEERDYPAVSAVLADCSDRVRMRAVFERHHPEVVFHAAAYKHVAMLESNPMQAVTNNILGTRNLVEAAIEAGVDRFVLISTDKAANPRNMMGQSKAVCEWLIESYALRDDVATRFVAVRFGNVLGSSGSVIPIFRRQIERGGPVTVRHPDLTRFFMTIPEASSLVIQAGAMGGRGQVYVLDMGEPVRILDLAKEMIRLSGRKEEDVPIVFTGVLAGEKIHEVLWNEGEMVGPTSHPKIMRAARATIDPDWLEECLAELERLAESARHARRRREGLGDDQRARTGSAPKRFWKTRCTNGTCARRSAPVRWLGGPSRRPEPGAAARRRGGARAGLHPRRRRLGQDDDDHAAHRAAGRAGRVSARTRSWR